MAKRIQDRYDGKIPANRIELLDIPGVGDYVADAMLVFAFKRRTIVDSNVVRKEGRE
jgi:A/G-specific adenine glycosylase